MKNKLYQPNQLDQNLDELIQDNLDLTIELHVANREVDKLKLKVERLITEYSALLVFYASEQSKS